MPLPLHTVSQRRRDRRVQRVCLRTKSIWICLEVEIIGGEGQDRNGMASNPDFGESLLHLYKDDIAFR